MYTLKDTHPLAVKMVALEQYLEEHGITIEPHHNGSLRISDGDTEAFIGNEFGFATVAELPRVTDEEKLVLIDH